MINHQFKNIIYIVVIWALFIYIGYNVLTVDAEKDCSSISEPDDDFYCKDFDWGPFHPDKQFVDELCDASEDYAKNPKHCDKAYDMVEKKEKEEQKNIEKSCDKAGAKMNEKGECDIHGDGKKADKFYEEQSKLEQEQQPIEAWKNLDDTHHWVNPTHIEPKEADSSEANDDYIAEYNKEADEAEFDEEDVSDAQEADSSEENESEDEGEEEEDDGGEDDSNEE